MLSYGGSGGAETGGRSGSGFDPPLSRAPPLTRGGRSRSPPSSGVGFHHGRDGGAPPAALRSRRGSPPPPSVSGGGPVDDSLEAQEERHAAGTCHPCVFFAAGRCRNGGDCRSCHAPSHADRSSRQYAPLVLHRRNLCYVCTAFAANRSCDGKDAWHQFVFCHHPSHRFEGGGSSASQQGLPSGSNGGSSRRPPSSSTGGGGSFDYHAGGPSHSQQQPPHLHAAPPQQQPHHRHPQPHSHSQQQPPAKVRRLGNNDRERVSGSSPPPPAESSGGGAAGRCSGGGSSGGGCLGRDCRPCASYFAERRCIAQDRGERCANCHHPCHEEKGSGAYFHSVLHGTGRCTSCRAFAAGGCPLPAAACRFCHHPSHRPPPQSQQSKTQQQPLGAGSLAGGGAPRSSGVPSSQQPSAGVSLSAGASSQRASQGAGQQTAAAGASPIGSGAGGGRHPEECFPCVYYFCNAFGCARGDRCKRCHHEAHRDLKGGLHPSLILHGRGACQPCRKFQLTADCEKRECVFCHDPDHLPKKADGEGGGRGTRDTREPREDAVVGRDGVAISDQRDGRGEQTGGVDSNGGSPSSSRRGLGKGREEGAASGKAAAGSAASAARPPARKYTLPQQRVQFDEEAHQRGVCLPCVAFFCSPAGCTSASCRKCHDASHANPHSPAHPSVLLHLKQQCSPCSNLLLGCCQYEKAPALCCGCHHPDHLQSHREKQKRRAAAAGDAAKAEEGGGLAELRVSAAGENAAGAKKDGGERDAQQQRQQQQSHQSQALSQTQGDNQQRRREAPPTKAKEAAGGSLSSRRESADTAAAELTPEAKEVERRFDEQLEDLAADLHSDLEQRGADANEDAGDWWGEVSDTEHEQAAMQQEQLELLMRQREEAEREELLQRQKQQPSHRDGGANAAAAGRGEVGAGINSRRSSAASQEAQKTSALADKQSPSRPPKGGAETDVSAKLLSRNEGARGFAQSDAEATAHSFERQTR